MQSPVVLVSWHEWMNEFLEAIVWSQKFLVKANLLIFLFNGKIVFWEAGPFYLCFDSKLIFVVLNKVEQNSTCISLQTFYTKIKHKCILIELQFLDKCNKEILYLQCWNVLFYMQMAQQQIFLMEHILSFIRIDTHFTTAFYITEK